MENSILAFCPCALIMMGCEQPPVREMKFPEGIVQHAVHEADIQWRPCPPNLPSGCEMAVLEGNPQSAELFTVRFRVSGEFVMPPHSHPKHERVTESCPYHWVKSLNRGSLKVCLSNRRSLARRAG